MKKQILVFLIVLGTTVMAKSATPVLFLEAHINETKVELKWSFSLNKNSGYFIIQRSQDATNWNEVITLKFGKHNNQPINYFELDQAPLIGTSYYRVKVVAYNGDLGFSNVVPVCYKRDAQIKSIFPFSKDKFDTNSSAKASLKGQVFFVILRDRFGNEYYCKAHVTEIEEVLYAEPVNVNLPEGSYLVTASSNDMLYSHRLAIKE